MIRLKSWPASLMLNFFAILIIISVSNVIYAQQAFNTPTSLPVSSGQNNLMAFHGKCEAPKQGVPGLSGATGPAGPAGSTPAAVPAAYGEIYVEQGASLGFYSTASFKLLVFDTNGISFGTTPDAANGEVQINVSGNYLVSFSLGFYTMGDPGNLWTFVAAIDGVPQNNIRVLTSSPSSTVTNSIFTSIGATGLLTINAGSKVAIYFSQNLPFKAYGLTVASGNLHVEQLNYEQVN